LQTINFFWFLFIFAFCPYMKVDFGKGLGGDAVTGVRKWGGWWAEKGAGWATWGDIVSRQWLQLLSAVWVHSLTAVAWTRRNGHRGDNFQLLSLTYYIRWQAWHEMFVSSSSHPSNPSSSCYMGIGSYRGLTGPRIMTWQMPAKHKLSFWDKSIKFVSLYNMPYASSINICARYTSCKSLRIVICLSVSLTWKGNCRNGVKSKCQWILCCCVGCADHVILQGSIVLWSVLCLCRRSMEQVGD
jgi:hypothetical protein